MTLGEALRRQNNNADLFRLIASITVVFGHSYFLAPAAGIGEPISKLLHFDYSGSLAVKFFFFLSGLLIANSWISRQQPVHFALARIFRVFPALMVSAAACIFVLGPLLTTLPLREYFSNSSWMFEQVFAHPHRAYFLPGVFEHNAITLPNGAIWTIIYELLMYVAVLGLGMCGLFRSRAAAALAAVATIIWFLYRPESITILGVSNVNDAGLLPAFFAFGVLLALFKDYVSIDGKVIIGLCLIAWLLKDGPVFRYAFYPAFLLAPIWLMTTEPIKAIKLPDFSYGVYVYGWPIQQTFASLLPTHGPHVNQALSIPVSILFGAVSWYAIERPAIALGKRIPELVSRLVGPQLAHSARAQET
jgi:peptidoglycan/LPS O-acetylase OafA/YrhL